MIDEERGRQRITEIPIETAKKTWELLQWYHGEMAAASLMAPQSVVQAAHEEGISLGHVKFEISPAGRIPDWDALDDEEREAFAHVATAHLLPNLTVVGQEIREHRLARVAPARGHG